MALPLYPWRTPQKSSDGVHGQGSSRMIADMLRPSECRKPSCAHAAIHVLRGLSEEESSQHLSSPRHTSTDLRSLSYCLRTRIQPLPHPEKIPLTQQILESVVIRTRQSRPVLPCAETGCRIRLGSAQLVLADTLRRRTVPPARVSAGTYTGLNAAA